MEWRPAGDSQLKSDTRRILLLSQAMCLERCCTLGPGSSEGTSGEANSVAGRKGSIKGWSEGARTRQSQGWGCTNDFSPTQAGPPRKARVWADQPLPATPGGPGPVPCSLGEPGHIWVDPSSLVCTVSPGLLHLLFTWTSGLPPHIALLPGLLTLPTLLPLWPIPLKGSPRDHQAAWC